jgi:hypothetical protein
MERKAYGRRLLQKSASGRFAVRPDTGRRLQHGHAFRRRDRGGREIEEVTDRMFDDSGGWSDPAMKNRYRRKKPRNTNKVVVLRQAARNRE